MFIIITISLILLFCQLTYKAQYIYSIDNDRILTYCLVLSLIDSRRNVYERYRYPRTEVWKNEKPSNNEQALSEDQDDVRIRNENKRKVDDETDISSIRSKLQRKNEQKHEHKNKTKADNEYDTDDDDEELTSQKRKREEIKREIIELQREMKGLKDKNAQKEVKVETSDKSNSGKSTKKKRYRKDKAHSRYRRKVPNKLVPGIY